MKHIYVLIAFAVGSALSAKADVQIDGETFPDEGFRSYITNQIDSNKNGVLDDTEIAATTSIDLYYEIGDLTGLELFENLESLSLYSFKPGIFRGTSQSLKKLSITDSNKRIYRADFSGFPSLEYLSVDGTDMPTIDITPLVALKEFSLSNANIIDVDFSHSKLENINFSYVPLRTLNVMSVYTLSKLELQNVELEELMLARNNVKTLLIYNAPYLTNLMLNSSLESLSIHDTPLRKFDCSQFPQLKSLNLGNTQLMSIDVSAATGLTDFFAFGNGRTYTMDSNGLVDISDAIEDGFQWAKVKSWNGAEKYDETHIHITNPSYVNYSYDNGYLAATYDWYKTTSFDIKIETSQPIDRNTFPDMRFRKYVSDVIDTNHNGSLEASEISAVTTIDISGMGISDLTGLQKFTGIKKLIASHNELRKVPQVLSGCYSIEYLDLSDNRIETYENMPYSIKTLILAGNSLTNVPDYINNVKCLDLSRNHIETIKCDNWSNLEKLIISDNGLSDVSLNFSVNRYSRPKLHYLDVSNNNLSDFNPGRLTTVLDTLIVSGNRLEGLNIIPNSAIRYLDVSNNDLKSLELVANVALEYLDYRNNELVAIDFGSNRQLTDVRGSGNRREFKVNFGDPLPLSSLGNDFDPARAYGWNGAALDGDNLIFTSDVVTYSYQTNSPNAVGAIFCLDIKNQYNIEINEENFPDFNFRVAATVFDTDDDNHLSTEELDNATIIDISGLTITTLKGVEYFYNLRSLIASSNQLTEVDFYNNKKLETLNVGGNQLTSIDVHNLLNLKTLIVSSNPLTKIDLSRNVNLAALSIEYTNILAIDLSNNINLQYDISMSNNYREVYIDRSNTFDTRKIEGFDPTKITQSNGGVIDENGVIIFDEPDGENEPCFSYSYNASIPGNAWMSLYGFIFPTVFDVDIDTTNFPDERMRDYVESEFDNDANQRLTFDEVSAVKSLDLAGLGLRNIKGIENFVDLEILDISDNSIVAADLMANKNLREFVAENIVREVELGDDNSFRLSQLSDDGFKFTNSSDWTGCNRIFDKLIFLESDVTYSYDTNNSAAGSFKVTLRAPMFVDIEKTYGDSDMSVSGREGAIEVTGARTDVCVYNMQGLMVYKGTESHIDVQSGVYAVLVNGKILKVTVK